MIGEGSMLKRGLVGCGIVVVAASMGCRAAPTPVDARILTDWMRAQYALVRAERLSPPVASRVFAYGAVALYEAVAAGSPRLRSLVGQLNELNELPRPQPRERYDWTIVTVSAETTLLKVLFKEGLPATQLAIAQLGDSQIAARRASRPVRDRSTADGAALGRAILDWATGDRFSETGGLAWKPAQGRRYWVNTAEPEQREISSYWADKAGGYGTPPGHWVLIASQLVADQQVDGERPARMLVLTIVAVAGAFISCWHEKFSWSLVRHVTYIRRGVDP